MPSTIELYSLSNSCEFIKFPVFYTRNSILFLIDNIIQFFLNKLALSSLFNNMSNLIINISLTEKYHHDARQGGRTLTKIAKMCW